MLTRHTWMLVVALIACAGTLGCERRIELGAVANSDEASRIREALVGEGGGTTAADQPVGTGWATLKGTFTFEGDPPAMPPYDVNKDQATCAPGGQMPLQETLVVDGGTHGIANIAIYARKVSRVNDSA